MRHAADRATGHMCHPRHFFFSSRRRHTRCLSDWSSDVCSSDLNLTWGDKDYRTLYITATTSVYKLRIRAQGFVPYLAKLRSEERRVGKECRSRCLTVE